MGRVTDHGDHTLAHYGIKGMKWGRRRTDAQIARAKEEAHADAVNVKTLKSRVKTSGTDALGNKELQDVITRLNLEQQYSKLSPTTSSRGKKIAKDLLGNAAKETAKEIAKTQMKDIANLALDLAKS